MLNQRIYVLLVLRGTVKLSSVEFKQSVCVCVCVCVHVYVYICRVDVI